MKRAGAVVLAAGASRRMGSPKALLRLAEGSFVERIVQTLHASAIDPIAVVVGREAAAIRKAHPDLAVRWVINPEPDRGMLSSLRLGLEAVAGAGISGVLVWPVDHPRVVAGTVQAIVEAAAENKIVVPRHRGRSGHPAFFGAAFLAELAGAELPGGARDLLDRHPEATVAVEADETVLDDIDTPEDLARILP